MVFKYSGRAEGWDFERCSRCQAPKAYGNPEGPEHLLPKDFENPTLYYISLVRYKTHESNTVRVTHRSASPLPSSMQGPSVAHGSQRVSYAPILGHPDTPLHVCYGRTGVIQRHVFTAAYSTACKNEQSTKE